MGMRSWTGLGAVGLVVLTTTAAVGCSGGGKAAGGDTGASSSGGGDGGGDGGDGGEGEGGDRYTIDDFINVTDSPTGDFTGFEGGYEAQGAWLSQTIDESLIQEVPLSGKVEDFQEETGVPEANLELYFTDEIGGVPDESATTDSEGNFSGAMAQTCTAVAYKTATNPDLQDTKNTFERHQVFGAGSSLTETFNSVSTQTYALIPGLLGISPDPNKGIAAGTVYDSNGDPVEGAQVVIVDADGKLPDTLVVKYFIDDFPNRDQPYTSPDGLWVAIDIPTGNWRVDAYIWDGSQHVRIATSTVTIYADSINISNLNTGYDSVRYPDSCLAAG
jgi:protocatechuate 3,4-dioxygenase beta subunit